MEPALRIMSVLALLGAITVPLAAPIKALADEIAFNPADDLPGYWVVSEINGKPMVSPNEEDLAQPVMDFDLNGTFGGYSLCNHFLGDIKLDKQAVSISNFATTNASCGEAETEFLDVLKHVKSLKATEDGVLLQADDNRSLLITNASD
jgi:heat shock protein HslJ